MSLLAFVADKLILPEVVLLPCRYLGTCKLLVFFQNLCKDGI